MSSFLDALRSGRVLLMDGAMGTELQRAGLKPGENAAAWNVRHPKRVRAVHQAYRDAGAEVLLTNTFQACAVALPQFNMIRLRETCHTGARIAREAAHSTSWTVADLGPLVSPTSGKEFDGGEALAIVSSGVYFTAPADAVLLETCSSPRVRLAVRRACQSPLNRPVLLSLSFLRNASGELVTFSGHSPEWFARRAKQYGLAALGVNCGRDISVADCAEIVRRYRRVTDLPLFARPNAGTPKKVRGRWVYPLTPEAMADALPELLEAGVSMVGGCCGTTPEHIAALRPVVARWNRRR
jgi:methionine synthase I (cobalamin-dependent)